MRIASSTIKRSCNENEKHNLPSSFLPFQKKRIEPVKYKYQNIMETIPRIYAQVSDQNDRILSLVSSVLMRKMRQKTATIHRFPSSLEIGSTTVAIVLITTSTAFQQLLFQITQNTCLHLFVVNSATNANEQWQSIQQLIDPSIPLLLVTDGLWRQSDFVRPRRAWLSAIHFFPSSVPHAATMNSRIVVLTNEQQFVVNSPETICVVVPPGTATDVWKCRLILKYIQAMVSVETRWQHSKL